MCSSLSTICDSSLSSAFTQGLCLDLYLYGEASRPNVGHSFL